MKENQPEVLTRKEQAKLLKRWVEALRSRKYKQTKGHLRANDGFCCLGVLCDLVSPERWSKREPFVDFYIYVEKETQVVPEEVAKKIGFIRRNQQTLSSWNDEGRTFEEIAEYIENSPHLFFNDI